MTAHDLTGRKALVTGGARGLGAGMAEALARAGASIMIGDILADEGQQTAASIRESGATADFVTLDLTDDASWDAAVSKTVADLAGFDILINNAGIEISALVIDLDPADLRRMLDVNAVGVGLKHAFRAMRPGGSAGVGGAIVRLGGRRDDPFPGIAGSPRPSRPLPAHPGRCAKSGKLGYGVRVNCLYPARAHRHGHKARRRYGVAWPVAERRGRGRRRYRTDPARQARRGRRHGRRGGIPRLRRCPFHHWGRPAGRRRHGHVTLRTSDDERLPS